MSDEIKRSKSKWLTFALGAAVGIAVTLVFMLIFAAVIYFFGLDRAYSVPLATICLAFGSLSAAYFVSKRTGQRGYLVGLIVGLISFAAVTVISLIVNRTGITVNTAFHFIIILLASAIGGIAGVNRGKNKKYI